MKPIRKFRGCLNTVLVCITLALTPAVFAADPPAKMTTALEQVDINSADATTIAQVMDGVGMVKAQEIVAYRELNGAFESIDQLMEVKGIGQATIEKNRHRIVIASK
ncbi:MAG: helix-hairpin-helix domain-containing protein [Gammaproteobacteria bacterium]|nr:helix-hairpin-helix domain-containing protein [Gammaproteobacteria bacterium]